MTREVSQRHAPRRCYYCGVYGGVTREHDVPWSQGGRGRANIVLACALCNRIKGTRTGEEFIAWLASEEGRAWFHRRGLHREIIDNGCPECVQTRESMRRKWVTWVLRKHGDSDLAEAAAV